MPRTRGKKGAKASPKKAPAGDNEILEPVSVAEESVPEEQIASENVMESEDLQVHENKTQNVEETPKDTEKVVKVITQEESMETEEKAAKVEEKGTKTDEIEECREPLYKPHTFPTFTNKSLIEKWEWHIRAYPIDQADIRSCILESVSKIAQETWMFIDNQNYGMGAFDMCMKNASDAAVVVLKILAMPMSYRYLTLKVTRRGKNVNEVQKITKKKELMAEDENDFDEELDNLPFSETCEKATMLLDYTQTYVLNKVKGQKKRNLYVKYLPEGTSKELLKVLFPVANNLDIIKTSKGRRVGELNVSTIPNILGICNAYVTTFINGIRNITLDWKEENIEDNRLLKESHDELPWEIIPRDFEYPYETVPYIEIDDVNEYGRKRKREESQKQMERERDRDGDRFGRRRDRDRIREIPPEVGNVLRMQHQMNERINSQVALLAAVGDPTQFDGPPSLLGSAPPGFHGPAFRRDRRDDKRGGRSDRNDRDRRNSSGGRGGDGSKDKKDGERSKGKEKEEKKSRWDKDDAPKTPTPGDIQKPSPVKERNFGRDMKSTQGPGARSGGSGDGGNWGGDGGRWGGEPGRGTSLLGRGGRFEEPRRGGRFDNGGPRRDQGGRGNRFDDFGRGGRFGERGGRGRRFEGDGRPGMMGEGPSMDKVGRGGRFDRGGRGGGQRGGTAFGQGNAFNTQNKGNAGNQGMGNNQNFGYNQGVGNQSGNVGDYQNQAFGNQMSGGGYGNQMSGGGYGNQFNTSGGFMNQGASNQSVDNYGMSGFNNQQNQSGTYGNQQSQQSGGFINQQNQSSSYGNLQTQSGSFGNQSGGFGNQNQTGGFNNMQGTGSFGNQSKSAAGYGNQTKQSSGFSNQSNQSNSGSFGYGSQNMMLNQQQTPYGGSHDSSKTTSTKNQISNQNSFGLNTQSTLGSQMNTLKTQTASKNQATGASLNQQSVGSSATQNQQTMGSYDAQSFNTQQGSYGNQNYGGYDDSSFQQNYLNQSNIYAGYSTADNSGAWAQPQSDFSQYGNQSQNTMTQASYSTATTNASQTDSYNTTSYSTQSGYSADAAFANQGFYAAPPTNANTAYNEYSTQDQSAAYATGNSSNLSNMATYNFASYNTGS